MGSKGEDLQERSIKVFIQKRVQNKNIAGLNNTSVLRVRYISTKYTYIKNIFYFIVSNSFRGLLQCKIIII